MSQRPVHDIIFNDFTFDQVCKEIALEVESLSDPRKKDILTITKKLCSKHKLSSLPGNQKILKYVNPKSKVRKLLKVKPVIYRIF